MCPRLHRYATPRQTAEYLLHGFRCGRQFLLQNDFSCFIQDAVRTGAISQIHTNGELPFENVFPTRPHSANLLHCRSPFSLCLEHVEHWERIASRWRPAFSSHLINVTNGKSGLQYLAMRRDVHVVGKVKVAERSPVTFACCVSA